MNMRGRTSALLLAGLAFIACAAHAVDLPPSCATTATPTDTQTPLSELKKRVEALNETDPIAAFALLCAAAPRVAREYGEQSVELAWWMGSFATPLIAYMDKYDEALPVLQFAQPILERNYGKYGEPLGDIHVAYAWTYFRQGKLTAAGAAWQQALAVRERIPGKNKIELQKVLVGLAQVQLAQRNFAAAQQTLERAHGILVDNKDLVSEAGAAIENALTNVALRQERFEEARRHAEEQLRIEGQLAHGAQQLVPAYALLGRIWERLDEYEKAEAALRKAIALAEGAQGPLQRHHFSALYQLAALLDDRGKPVEAHDAAARALTIGETTLGLKAPRLVPVLQVLGDSEHRLGDLPAALRHFDRAGTIVAADGDNVERQWQMAYYRDLGALQINLGDVVAAENTLRKGLSVAGEDATLSIPRAHLHIDHARAAQRLGQPGGRAELLQALTLLRTRLPESHPAILRVLNELCALELATPANDTPTCDAVKKQLDAARDTQPDLRALAYDNQSRLAAARNDLVAAQVLAVRGVAAAESAGTPEPLVQAYFQIAQVLRRQQQNAVAIFFGKQAIAEIERERRYFTGADAHFDSGFLRDKVDIYRNLADWLLESGRIDEGLAVLALMKGEELSDFGVRDARVSGTPRRIELTDMESALRDRYARTTQVDRGAAAELTRLGALQEAGRISPTERARLNGLLAGKGLVEAQRAQHIALLLTNNTAKAPTDAQRERTISAPALARAAAIFGPDTAFAVYLLTAQHLRILVSARGQQAEFRIPIDAAQLQRDIGHFLDDIVQQRNVANAAEKLYGVIARDVDRFAAARGAHRLALWLDGALRYVPIAALHDGQRYLVDKYTIQTYTPAPDGTRTSIRPTRMLVRGVGVTQAIGGFPALPAVADELCYVVQGRIDGLHSTRAACDAAPNYHGVLRGEGFADAAFTAPRFTELLSGPHDFSVLHVGTHFRLRPGNALRSFLLLGDGSQLTLNAIAALDFHDIDVVTLSACETGMGGAHTDDGREIEGLSTLVQRRGAGRVIASLWRVDDVSTAELMRTLYKAFSATRGDAALGLQQAQLALRKVGKRGDRDYANPYYWAGFSVAGSGP